MNARSLVTIGLVVGCFAMIALGATINRVGSGGLWSTVNQWDPNQLPGASDTANHGASASGVMTFDSAVQQADRDIGAFTAVAGDNRGLVIDDGLDLTVLSDFTRSSGTGAYVTELMDGSTLDVSDTIVQGDWIVNAGATVLAGAISLGSSTDTDWDVSGLVDVDGDVDYVETDPNAVTISAFFIFSGGELLVGGDASFADFRINTGASADVAGDIGSDNLIRVNGGTLTAGSAGTVGSSPSLGTFAITDSGTATVEGELRVRTDDMLNYGSGTNSLTVGSLNFANAASELHTADGTLALDVSGDIDVATTVVNPSGSPPFPFDAYGITLTLNGSSAQDVEVFTPDYDVNDVVVWQGLQKCGNENIYNVMPIAGLVVASGATVNLTDENVNILRGTLYSQDALYIEGDLDVPSGATLNADLPVYYTGDRFGTGTINGTAMQVTKVCYGDFDADGDVDLDDFGVFAQAFSGDGNESDNPLCSSNFDGDVDLTDYAILSQQFTGANQPCPTSCSESGGGGGEWTVESLAEWTLNHLTPAQIESFAETLYALAEAVGETQDAADMAELADLITAE